jgi:hypothetical protein
LKPNDDRRGDTAERFERQALGARAADSEDVIVTARLAASEGDGDTFTRTWDDTIPRDLL